MERTNMNGNTLLMRRLAAPSAGLDTVDEIDARALLGHLERRPRELRGRHVHIRVQRREVGFQLRM